MLKEIRRELIVSLVVTVLIMIFFQPLLNGISSIFIRVGGAISIGYLDSLYRNAALGHRNYVDVMIAFVMFSLLSGLSLIGTFALFRSQNENTVRTKLAKIPRRLVKIVGVVSFLLLAFSYVYLITSVFVDLQLNTSFEQRLTVLAPAISDQEYKEIKAHWAKMSRRADFDAINLRMDEIAKQRGVALPPLLLP